VYIVKIACASYWPLLIVIIIYYMIISSFESFVFEIDIKSYVFQLAQLFSVHSIKFCTVVDLILLLSVKSY